MLSDIKIKELNNCFAILLKECEQIGRYQEIEKANGGEKQKWINKVLENQKWMKQILWTLDRNNVEKKAIADIEKAKIDALITNKRK